MDQTDAFREVLAKLGVSFSEKGNRLEMRCIFHDDRTPSSGVYKNTGRFYCFTCELSLNAAQFFAKATGEDAEKASVELEEKYGPLEPEAEVELLRELAVLRAKAEAKLSRVTDGPEIYGRLSEQLDRIIYLAEGRVLEGEELDKYLKLWYNEVEGNLCKS